MAEFALGLDFGTESGRALLVDIAPGRGVASAVYPYADGVIDQTLPGVDANLSGLPIGLTLATRPPDVFRTLIEATAFGTQTIVETFEASGVAVNELIACGGLAAHNKLLLQTYADVTGRPFREAGSNYTSALGAAMFGAVAAGRESVADAAHRLSSYKENVY